MKKALGWIGLVLLSPVLLFLTTTILLYVPAVQNWAVDRAATLASQQTGLNISVDHVDLDFPLDLGLEGVRVVRPEGDTIADIHRLVADVELWPLLDGTVVVKELSVSDARINTFDFISDLQIQGHVGRLSAKSKGIDLNEGIVELNNARLNDANVTVLLSDTAAVDTTTTETPWRIKADSLTILRSRVNVHLPGDSMLVSAYMGRMKATEGDINLLQGIYTVKSFEWQEGQLTYDLPHEPKMPAGLDYNHLALSNIRIGMDSIYFSAPNLALKIREAVLREQSGLTVTQLAGAVLLDSAGVRLPNMTLSTPYSFIYTNAEADFSITDSLNPGQLLLNLKAQLGKEDLMLFMADLPDHFKTRWPQWPMSVTARLNGNTQKAHIYQFEMSLPTAFRASADGDVEGITDLKQLSGQLDVKAETYNLDFITSLLDKDQAGQYRIPNGITMAGQLEARKGRYDATVTMRESEGIVRADGWLDAKRFAYDAKVSIDGLNLHHFMPHDSIYTLTAHLNAKGQGTDFLKKTTWLEADVKVDHLRFGTLDADSLSLGALLKNGHAIATLTGHNQLLRGSINADALMSSKDLDATIVTDVQRLDLRAINVVEKPLVVGMCGHMDVESNLNDCHNLTGLIVDLYIKDSLNTYRPQDVGIRALTNADTTLVRLQSGNLVLKLDASNGYEQLADQLAAFTDTLAAQYQKRVIDQPALKRNLPNLQLYLTSGRDNPIANFLRSSANIDFKDVLVQMTASPEKGINGDAHIFSLNADSTRIDTIRLRLRDTDHGLTYQGIVANNRRNPQFIFRSLIDGHVHDKGAVVGVRFYDDKGNLGLRMGLSAAMADDGIMFNLMPQRPTIGYKEFNLNKDNFLLLHQNLRLESKVDLIADDGTGVKIYSEQQDSTLLQDLTVSLHRFDLEKLTSVIPYMPRITGFLDGDFHLIMDEKEQISIASDMQVDNMTYEKSPIGNLGTEIVYLQREDESHAVEGVLMLDDKKIGSLRGEYRPAKENEMEGIGHVKDFLDANLVLNRFPMMIVNGMVPDQLLGLEGFAEGEMKVIGTLDKPKVDGEVFLDSAYLISKPYGLRLRFDNDPVRIINSKLLLENFTMYAYNDNPLNIMGDIDFHDTERITMNVRMRAQNYQLINAKQTKESIAYGKAFVNFFATMNGRLDQLRMRGRLDVLGTTDVTYLLLDSPLSTDNQLDELVKFTDFSDSTQTVVEKPAPEGLNVDMTISIDQGVHVHCGLNADQSNYVDLFGGGDLRMRYNDEGITMTGRYTVNSGEMKYSLPIIPLKTFSIQNGSYVEFTGDPTNPRLNLTATERTRAAVSEEGQQGRSVLFDCGVVITKTLNDMGLQFIIDAPEDMTVSSDLNSMSTEERGKLAVTMLTTGMYLANGNTSGFSMNSALSSFLQSEINNITGNALKTLDLSVGLDNSTDASGNMHTDYSFKFAKRFWNNRLNVQISGKVSTGEEVQGQNQSFFDNVTMEYRLSPTSNQYVKLFYKQNVYDWLEGYTGQYGGGYLWKRKLNSLFDLFRKEQKVQGPGMRDANRDANVPRRKE
jgi:hypothetical protein